LTSFPDAYRAWRKRPFPLGSTNDALDDLHADLALADTWVAEAVVPYIERGVHQPLQFAVIPELTRLRTRADEVAKEVGPADIRLANEYGEYVDLLMNVYRAFLKQKTASPASD
jgi:hypothetical protein